MIRNERANETSHSIRWTTTRRREDGNKISTSLPLRQCDTILFTFFLHPDSSLRFNKILFKRWCRWKLKVAVASVECRKYYYLIPEEENQLNLFFFNLFSNYCACCLVNEYSDLFKRFEKPLKHNWTHTKIFLLKLIFTLLSSISIDSNEIRCFPEWKQTTSSWKKFFSFSWKVAGGLRALLNSYRRTISRDVMMKKVCKVVKTWTFSISRQNNAM